MKKKLLVFNLLILNAAASYAQGIKFNTLCWSNDFKSKVDEESTTNFMSDWYYGIGYEQNIGDKLAVSLCFNSSLGKTFGKEDVNTKYIYYTDINGNENSYPYEYTSYISYTGLSYESKYFFNENDDNSMYVSSGIGFKSVKWTFIAASDYNIPDSLITFTAGTMIDKTTIIPLSIKIGGRGSMDGWFGDWFLGFNYNLGVDKLPAKQSFKDLEFEKPMHKLAFTAGYSFGIGWAD